MNSSQSRRMWLVASVMAFAAFIVVLRLFNFQVLQREELIDIMTDKELVVDLPERGVIYDRNGAIMAVDRLDYRVAVSPSVLTDPEELANSLSPILQIPRGQLLYQMEADVKYQILAGRVTSDVAEAIRDVKNGDEVQLEPLPRRFYPQDDLMCHVLGFVNYDNVATEGVEGKYQQDLKGQEASAEVFISPLMRQTTVIAREGADLVLTIDRSVQYVVEQHLKRALQEHGAVSGSIIVMDPRSGAILAAAAQPCYSPNRFNEHYVDRNSNPFSNPLVSEVYEPGSVMKLITMAVALDSGAVTPETTYNDTGAFQAGGSVFYNWDRGAHGTVDMTTLLSRSLNVGAATIATWVGPEKFLDYLYRFGFGHKTEVDIMNEVDGLMPGPNSGDWLDSFLATYSFGQGLAVTPLQMVSSVSALANGGKLMQPYVVAEIHGEHGVERHVPTGDQVISPTTAAQMTTMATIAVQAEVQEALVEGYTVAGKTGTAQILNPFGGYHPTDVIGSFIGWLPADDPRIIILVKLDRPTSAPWGSMTAAPVFSELASELVVLLDIPPDAVRLQANNISGGAN